MPETPIFPPGHNPSVQAVAQPEQNNAANGSSAAEPKTEAMDVTMNEIAPEATNVCLLSIACSNLAGSKYFQKAELTISISLKRI